MPSFARAASASSSIVRYRQGQLAASRKLWRPPQEKLHFLDIKGNEVFKFAVSAFRRLLEKQMRDFDFGPDELGLVVPHQVNYRIIESALKKLEVPEERIFMNLEKYGNTSGASVGIALDEAIREGRPQEGKYLSLIAFGAGLTWASALLRW